MLFVWFACSIPMHHFIDLFYYMKHFRSKKFHTFLYVWCTYGMMLITVKWITFPWLLQPLPLNSITITQWHKTPPPYHLQKKLSKDAESGPALSPEASSTPPSNTPSRSETGRGQCRCFRRLLRSYSACTTRSPRAPTLVTSANLCRRLELFFFALPPAHLSFLLRSKKWVGLRAQFIWCFLCAYFDVAVWILAMPMELLEKLKKYTFSLKKRS